MDEQSAHARRVGVLRPRDIGCVLIARSSFLDDHVYGQSPIGTPTMWPKRNACRFREPVDRAARFPFVELQQEYGGEG